MRFEITLPNKYAAIEVSPTFKGDLTLVLAHEAMPILAKQVIDHMDIVDLARLFDAKQIEALKKALSEIELDNEASEVGLIK